MLAVLLVRHAEPVSPDSGLGEHERPLTERGFRDAEALAAAIAAPTAVYSSPYPRAVQTVEPIARRHGLAVEILDDLRERMLSPVAIADWQQHNERAWRDFDYAAPGGEPNRAAQARARGVLATLRARHDAGTLVVGGHGTWITLALQTIDPTIGHTFWSRIAMPDVYRLEHDGAWRLGARAR